MKRYMVYGIVILLAAGSLYMAIAATDSNMPMMGRRQMGKGMMPDMKAGCPMCTMRCGAMMQKQIAPTEDGGVIVMACGELMKFDKDLNLAKKIDIPVDEAKMEAKMKAMMEKCPMCKMMKQNMQSTTNEGM
ncbi:MAG: hypothetical protein PHF37_02075 [Phycisphaerae bacterium]|nr:hypothetical protein [Phycisphaerae bacterium]